MEPEFEVRKVRKVVVQGLGPEGVISPISINQFWFVVERIKTGQRFSEHDDEVDAIAECKKLNSRQEGNR